MTNPLRRRVLGATKWTAASVASAAAAQFLQYLVLARVLEPRQIGQIATVSLIIGLADLVVGLGVPQAVVQRRAVTSRELSSLYWLNFFAAVVFACCVWLVAAPVAAVFDDSAVIDLIRLASVLLVISSFGQISKALLEKRLEFQRIAVAETLSSVVLLGATVGLALAGVGASSAVWGLIVAALVRNLAYRVAARRLFRLRLRFAFKDTRRFLEFGLLQGVDAIINYVQNALSTFVTGLAVGTGAMGGYNLTYQLGVNMPARLNPVVTRVMFPVFSTLNAKDPRMRSGYELLGLTVSLMSVPALLCLSVLSEPVLDLLYGSQWGQFAPVLSILCLVGALRAIGNPVGAVIQATDSMRLGVLVNIGKAAITIPLIVAGGFIGGAIGAASGVAIAQLLSVSTSALLLRHLIGLSVRRFVAAHGLPFLLSLPMLAVVVGLRFLLENFNSLAATTLEAAISVVVLLVTIRLWPDLRLAEVRASVFEQVRPRVKRAQSIAVVLPAEERFDGTGGAVAHWVQRVYRESPRSYRIYCPSVGEPFAAGLATDRGSLYGFLVGLDRTMQAVLRGAPGASRSRVLRNGRIYLMVVAPKIARASIVHVHNRPSYAIWLRKWGYRGKIVLHMHNDLEYYASRTGDALRASVDSIFFCSDYLRVKAEGEFRLDGINTATVYNGVDPQPRPSSHATVGRHLLFAGRMIEGKGAIEAIGICERMLKAGGRYSLSLVGGPSSGSLVKDSDYYREVSASAEKVNSRFGSGTVVVRGHINHDSLIDEMRRSWAFLYPCRWEEPFGLVVAEALAAGLPVVASARGGIPEILTDGRTGKLIEEADDMAAFVQALRWLEEAERRTELSTEGWKTASKNFSWAVIADRTFALL